MKLVIPFPLPGLFQPTSPVRETTLPDGLSVGGYLFQPTSPVRETTDLELAHKLTDTVFQPTSPVRETTPHLTKQAQSDSEPNK